MKKLDRKVMAYLTSSGLALSVVLSGSLLVAPNEGKINNTYVDPVAILTSCYGHTGKELQLGQKYTDDQCYKILAEDLLEAKQKVDDLIDVPLNPYQEAALISFTYNAGGGNLATSTMRKKFNSGDYIGGCHELTKWVYAKGKKLNGLVSRRADEESVCLGKLEVRTLVQNEVGK